MSSSFKERACLIQPWRRRQLRNVLAAKPAATDYLEVERKRKEIQPENSISKRNKTIMMEQDGRRDKYLSIKLIFNLFRKITGSELSTCAENVPRSGSVNFVPVPAKWI